MKLLDLFAGIGGFSLAAHCLGWQTAAFVERDEFCQKVLRKNFGEIPIHDDIFTFSGKPFRGNCDIITGGFPCQPFSAAGKRAGREDERYLFPQMLRVISEVKPRWIVAENVRGLLSIESGQVFAEIITSLESEGYEVVTFCIPASAVNAPHKRDRLWIIANRVGSRELQQKRIEQNFGRRVGDGDKPIIADTAKQGLPLAGLGRLGQFETQKGKRMDGRFELENSESFADTESVFARGLSVRKKAQNSRYQQRSCNAWGESWLDIALRTCVRGMDDGLSDELDIVGSRDNRTNRLKALGNSIIPAIAYEIFRAIEQAESEFIERSA